MESLQEPVHDFRFKKRTQTRATLRHELKIIDIDIDIIKTKTKN